LEFGAIVQIDLTLPSPAIHFYMTLKKMLFFFVFVFVFFTTIASDLKGQFTPK